MAVSGIQIAVQKLRLWITAILASAVLIWVIVLILRGTPVTWEHLWPFGTVVSILVALVAGFNRWAWSWPVFQGWFVNRPDLRGTWKAVLHTEWSNGESVDAPADIEGYMTIQQTMTTLHMRLMTKESVSSLIAHSIFLSEDVIYTVAGLYLNQPNIALRGDRSEIHYGSLLLEVEGNPPTSLSGHYWTDRNTRGSMLLSARISSLFSTYESASKEHRGEETP